jgi:hypothetical protein
MNHYRTNLPEAQRRAKALLEQPLADVAGAEAAQDFIVATPSWHVPLEKIAEYLQDTRPEEHIIEEPEPNPATYNVRQALTAILRYAFYLPISDAIETRSLDQKSLDLISEHSEEAKKMLEFCWALDDLANGREANPPHLAEGLRILKQMRQEYALDYHEMYENARNNSDLLEQEHYRQRAETIVNDCGDGKPIPAYIPDTLKRKLSADDFHENKTGDVGRLLALIKQNEPITAEDYERAQESFIISTEIPRSIVDALPSIIQELQTIAIDAGAIPARVRRSNGGPPSR